MANAKEQIVTTLQSTSHLIHRPRTRLRIGLVAIAGLIAIGVAVLIIVLTDTQRTHSANSTSQNTPSAIRTNSDYVRAEHSFGAVP